MTTLDPQIPTTSGPSSHGGTAFCPFSHEGYYDVINVAQQEDPVFFCPDIGYWVVTRRADVLQILADPDTYSASATLLPIRPFPADFVATMRSGGFSFEPTLVNSDGAVHDRLRRAATRFMNIKRFYGLEGQIRQIVREHIAAIDTRAQTDLVATLTYDVPARILCLLLGIEDVPARQIKTWADHRLFLTFGELDKTARDEAGAQLLDYWRYCETMVAARQDRPGDDYVSALLAIRNGDDTVLSLKDITGLVFGVMLAGHETTTNASGNLIYALMRNRAQWDRLLADRDLIPGAVEEGLRYASSVVNWRRRVTRAAQLGGVDLPEGALVLVSLAGANNDPAFCAQPRRFDIARPEARQHVAFGKGKHHCIGAPLARLQLRIILEELLGAFPDMRLAPGFSPDWIRTATFRGLTRLDVVTGQRKEA